jgi:hypothetical protein
MYLSFVLGNLLGRAIVSFALVWLIWLTVSRLNWRLAWQRSRSWYSLLAVVALSLLGLGSAIVQNGGLR